MTKASAAPAPVFIPNPKARLFDQVPKTGVFIIVLPHGTCGLAVLWGCQWMPHCLPGDWDVGLRPFRACVFSTRRSWASSLRLCSPGYHIAGFQPQRAYAHGGRCMRLMVDSLRCGSPAALNTSFRGLSRPG